MMNASILRLPYAVLAIIMGTALSRFGTAMVLPYVTIFLVTQKDLDMSWAGITIGVSFLTEAFGASLTSRILSGFESFSLIKMATYLYAFVFILIGLISIYLENIWLIGVLFVFCFGVIGVCRSLIETMGQSIISHVTPTSEKNFAFSLRYTGINIGTSLGPLSAITLGVLNTNSVFFVAAFFVVLYAVILQLTVHIHDAPLHNDKHQTFFDLFRLFLIDKKLLYFVSAMILCLIGFTQMETLFAYVAFYYTGNTQVFAVMYLINGVCIVLLQMPLVKFIDEFNLENVMIFGFSLLAISLMGIAFSTTHPFLYYISMFVFTLGEIFTSSLMGLYIDTIARPENRYAYFGISNFSTIGSVIGPPLATILCGYFGLTIGLICIAVVTACGVPLIWLAKKAPLF